MNSIRSLHHILSERAAESLHEDRPAGEAALLQADSLATSLCAAMSRIVLPLSRAAASFIAAGGCTDFGFARLEDYSRERLHRSGRWLRDLAALGKLLRQHHRLARAVTGDDGGRPIGRVAALLIGRGMPPHTHGVWIALARRRSIRQLRKSLREAVSHGSESPSSSEGPPNRSVTGKQPPSEDPVGNPACSADETEADAAQGDRTLVRIEVPHAIRVAFDEVLDLFRCIEGTEASVASFVEALVAEGIGPDVPSDVEEIPLVRTRGRALVEDLLARSTDDWAHLPAQAPERTEVAGAAADLLCFEALCRSAGEGDAAALDRQMRHLIRLEDRLSVRLGRLLMEMGERGAWARLRFAGPGHYAEERLRIGRSRAEDRVRAARSLRRFPALRDAYERGVIGLEATLQVVRLLGDGVVDRATEEAWVRHAVAATIKRIRDESWALGRGILLERPLREPERPTHGNTSPTPQSDRPNHGDTPPTPPRSGMRPPSRPLSDADWHASLHRAIGTARERVLRLGLLAAGARHDSMTPFADTASIAIPYSPDVFLRLRLQSELSASFLATIEASRRRLVREVEGDPWADPIPGAAARPSWIAARTFSIRARRIPAWVGLLALLEEFVHTWDRQHRSTNPARDAIYIRDGWRCSAPGCTSRRNLEDHHVVYRSRGGSYALSNRICLCRFHHQLGEHGELASCRGSAPLAITWRLGRAAIGGRYRNERRIEVAA